jgi:hypothetical protein
MEVVALLRLLWRLRLAVALGLLLSVGVAHHILGTTPTHVGVASLRVVLDTPTSQTVQDSPVGMTTLEWRTGLFADVMAEDQPRARIAERMGVPADQVVVTAPYMSVPAAVVPLPKAALESATSIAAPYQLAIQQVALMPIIGIDARAPTRAQAARLAQAAAAELNDLADRPWSDASEPFVAEPVGPPKAKDVASSPGRVMAVMAGVIAFLMWCAGLTVAATAWRGISRRRRVGRLRAPSAPAAG